MDPRLRRTGRTIEPGVWFSFVALAAVVLSITAVSGFHAVQHRAGGPRPFGESIASLEQETGAAPEVEVLDGLDGGVAGLSWSPDGERLAVAHGHTVSLIDARLLRAVARIHKPSTSPEIAAQAVAFSPDGSALAIAYADASIDLWDAASLKPIRPFEGLAGTVAGSLSFSGDGATVAAMLDIKAVRVWDVASGKVLWTSPVLVMDTALAAVSPDRWTVLAELPPGSVQRWNVRQNRPLWTREAHAQRVDVVALSPDGKTGATGAWDSDIVLWDVERGAPLRTLRGHHGTVHALAFSADGARVASAAWDDTVRVWDVLSGETLVTLRGCAGRRARLSWSPDGERLAAGSSAALCLWDVPSGRSLGTLEPHAAAVGRIDFGRDGGALALALPRNHAIAILNLQESGVSMVPTPCERCDPGAMALSPDGRRIAAPSGETSVGLWDLQPLRKTRDLPGSVDGVQAIAWSPDGKVLAAGAGDATIRLWDTDSGEPLGELRAPERGLDLVAFLPGGEDLISRAADGTVRVWRWRSGRAVRVHAASTSPGLLAVAESGAALGLSPPGSDVLTLRDLRSGATLRTLVTHSYWELTQAAISPDGLMVAAPVERPFFGELVLFDMRGSSPPRPFARRLLSPMPRAVTIAPRGRLLAAAYGDGSVVLFRLQDATIAATIRVTADGGAYAFTAQEVELFGSEARRHVSCRLGSWLLPLASCEARLAAPGLLRKLLGSHIESRQH